MPVKKEAVTKKPVVAKKADVVEAEVVKPAAPKKSGFSVPLYSLLGKVSGDLDLPKEIFGAEINKAILAQAVRVYNTNLKSHWSHTKTRGEVTGSTRKIYKQKGTGKARHGAITAPIFVGGGISLGPKSRKTILELPEKMRKVALVSALSSKMGDKKVFAVDGLNKASGKTKEMAGFVKKTEVRSMLLVTGERLDLVQRAAKNIKGLKFINANSINAFDVLRSGNLFVTKEAVEKLKERLTK